MENKELFAAMAKAFAAIEGATKDANNPHFKSKYADLSAVVNAIKPALVANGLWFAQVNHEQSGGVCIETILCNATGQQFSFGKLFVPAGRQDAQGYGSALTYARRYSLLTAFGVCPEDDDGNAAVKALRADPPPSQQPAATKCSAADVNRITELAPLAGKSLDVIKDAYRVNDIADLTESQAGAAIERLKNEIDKKAKDTA